MVTLAREFDACGECRLEVGGPDKYRALSDDEIRIVSLALDKCELEMRAAVFVERYADGGEMCADCRHSDQSGPGLGHTCKVVEGGTRGRPLNSTDCPALPDDLYPEVVTPNDRVEGRDAASSRRVPSHDGLCGNGSEVGAGDTAIKGKQ